MPSRGAEVAPATPSSQCGYVPPPAEDRPSWSAPCTMRTAGARPDPKIGQATWVPRTTSCTTAATKSAAAVGWRKRDASNRTGEPARARALGAIAEHGNASFVTCVSVCSSLANILAHSFSPSQTRAGCRRPMYRRRGRFFWSIAASSKSRRSDESSLQVREVEVMARILSRRPGFHRNPPCFPFETWLPLTRRFSRDEPVSVDVFTIRQAHRVGRDHVIEPRLAQCDPPSAFRACVDGDPFAVMNASVLPICSIAVSVQDVGPSRIAFAVQPVGPLSEQSQFATIGDDREIRRLPDRNGAGFRRKIRPSQRCIVSMR